MIIPVVTTVVQQAPGIYLYTHVWANMQLGDTGAPIRGDFFTYPSAGSTITGTFGAGGAVVLEASKDGATGWAVPNSVGTLDGPFFERPTTSISDWLRPNVVSGDDTTSLTYTLVGARTYK